jgi:hypothetical protein
VHSEVASERELVEFFDGLDAHELEDQTGQALPERTAMSTISTDIDGLVNFAMPINEAFALNYQSYQSIAIADADQTVIIGQVAVGEEGGTTP